MSLLQPKAGTLSEIEKGVTKVFFKGETMRKLILILLTATLSLSVACSKKKSNSVATPPPVTPTTPTYPGGYIPNFPAPINSAFHYGTVNITKRATYVNFLRAAFGYQTYNNGYDFGQQQDYGYNYNYSCDLNIFRWLFDDDLINCSNGQSQYNDYVSDLSYEKTMVQLLFQGDGTVKGLWLAGASMDFNGTMYAYEQIPFRGRLTQLADGRFMIEAGPLVFLTTSTSVTNFDVFYEETKFGNVTVR